MIRRPPRSTRTAHSFPTRRSSDLARYGLGEGFATGATFPFPSRPLFPVRVERSRGTHRDGAIPRGISTSLNANRSEEHTSELQSLMRISYAVFCLKKKKNNTTTLHTK